MLKYFEKEMQLLHHEAQEFASAFPEQAAMLNLKSIKDRDPYVERLLEGMAYLTAQVRRRIDDDIPEICETLLGQIWPHFLRPLPSMTIMQFTPRQGQLQQSQTLKKGTVLLSETVGNDRIYCRFRTSAEVKLQPIRLNRVSMEEKVPEGSILKIGFQLDSGLSADNLELDSLKFYLHSNPTTSLALHQVLCRQVKKVRILFPDQPTSHPFVLGGQENVSPCHLGIEDMLTPLSGRSFYGYHLLHEYFGFREKYLFFQIDRLAEVSWPKYCHSFELEIHLDHTFPKDIQITKDTFRIHCAPAINLFESESEPISADQRRPDYRVFADSSSPEGVEIYSINKVTGINVNNGSQHLYQPINHAGAQEGGGRFFQVINRETAKGPVSYLALGGNKGFTPETLSCRITASNGNYPRQHLVENSIKVPSPEIPSFVHFSNLTRPSKMLSPPQRDDYRLSLISHLSLNYTPLTSAASFKRLLHLYDWTDLDQNRRRIESIEDIEVEPVDRIQQGALMRGLRIKISVQEENFISQADIHLFGQVLHQFLSMYASLNTFTETKIICLPSLREYQWQPKFGANFLI